MSQPWTTIERGVSWTGQAHLLQKLAESRFGRIVNAVAESSVLNRVRTHVDVLFTRLVFKVFSGRR